MICEITVKLSVPVELEGNSGEIKESDLFAKYTNSWLKLQTVALYETEVILSQYIVLKTDWNNPSLGKKAGTFMSFNDKKTNISPLQRLWPQYCFFHFSQEISYSGVGK